MNLIHYLQGERPGMGSEIVMPDMFAQRLIAAISLSPSIVVSQSVLLADVSYYQASINFQTMKAAGISGVIIRAGQRNWVDERFSENWSKAAAADLPRGSYWFYDSREDPKKQAALWWSLIRDDIGELVHVADLEESYGGTYGKPEHFRTFVSEFQRLSRLPDDRIAVYTGYYWWQQRVGVDLFYKRFPLWLAWYADMSVVRIPAPWSADELLFWQYTSSGDGTKYGVSSKEIDLDWYCCSQVHFNQRFQLDGSIPPTTENPMTTYAGTGKLTSTPYTRVRKPNADGSLNSDGMTIGQINPGQAFKADKIAKDGMSRDWLHITEVGGKPIDGWAAAWLLDYAPETTTPPTTSTYADVPYTYTITLGGGDSPYVAQTITGGGILKVKP
jgi:GH25 family lysozyme M1 (1,4-beta-N-acetylmuramidase)